MARFAIFSYEFKPIYNAPELDFPDWETIDADESFKNRDTILQSFFEQEKVTFKVDEQNEYNNCIYIRKDNITVFRLANNKKLTGEDQFTKFEIPNHPSCHIFIDHHQESQHIAIQDYKKAFSSPNYVAKVIENVFNRYLLHFKLQLKLFPKTYTHGFWDIVDKFPTGFSKVRFCFPYPNMGKVADLAGPLMRKLSEVTNGDAIAESHSRGVESIRLDRNDDTLQDWISATSAAGSAELLPKGKQKWIQVDKESSVIVEYSESALKQLSDKDLFDSARDNVSTWLHGIKLVYE